MSSKNIFREKSLMKVDSPEDLNSYVRVVSPGIWVILCAIIILLAGALVWAFTTEIETATVPTAIVARSGTISIYVSEENKDLIKDGAELIIDDFSCTLPELEFSGVNLNSETDYTIMSVLGLEEDTIGYIAKLSADFGNGIYEGRIAIAKSSPVNLIFS